LMMLLLVTHYVGDFTPLATSEMQEAKAGRQSPLLILAHAAVHGALVLAAVSLVRPSWDIVATVAAFEFATHAGIDFAKMKFGVRFPVLRDPSGGPHWFLFGFDQLLHGLVLVAIVGYAL